MDFFDLTKTRRSIRKFKDRPPKREVIEKIIEAGQWAPSACNIQGWRFVVIEKDALKEKIFDMGGSIIIKTAPIAILVFYNKQTVNTEYQDYIQSASAAIQNMLLATHHLNLGACWINHLPRKKDLQKLFNVPPKYEPIACIILGEKANEQPKDMPRKHKLNQIIGYNTFKDEATSKEKEKKNTTNKILRKIYYLMPTFLKKILNNFIDKRFVKKFDN